MQSTHSLKPAVGTPGMPFDANNSANDIITCIAAEDLEPGRFVELASSDVDSGPAYVQLPQGTGATVTLLGVVLRDAQREQNTWPANASQGLKSGTRVAVMRRGRVFVERDSADTAAVARFDTPKIMHSSTSATKRGMLTQAATSTSAGSEVSTQSVAKVHQDTETSGLMLVEVNV